MVVPLLRYKYFPLARNVSKYSDMHYKLGVVISKKKPIAVGFNVAKTHTGLDTFSIHAEQKAIITAGQNLKGATIFIYREKTDGTPALAFPCEHCLKLIKEVGIKRIYFSINIFPYYAKMDLR